MQLRIRPGLAFVWRSANSLQIGGPDALVVLDEVGPGIEAMVTRLRGGAEHDTLVAVAVRSGARVDEAQAVLAALAGVLVAHGEDEAQPTISRILLRGSRPRIGEARSLAPVAAILRDRGHHVETAPPDPEECAGARGEAISRAVSTVVEVAEYVVTPRRYLPLLAGDVPHVAILLGDEDIVVTPRILPGRTPCLRCNDLVRRDADPQWPVVATQLAMLQARLVQPADLNLAAIAAADHLLAGAQTPRAVRIEVGSGRLLPHPWPAHAGCGCRGLPGNATVPGAAPPDPQTARRS